MKTINGLQTQIMPNGKRSNGVSRRPLPQKPSAWVCPDCGATIEPFRVQVSAGREMWIERKFCHCPDGQEKKRIAEAVRSHDEWIAAARELVADLDTTRWREYRFRDWDNSRYVGALSARNAVDDYVNNVQPRGKNWLLIAGGYGLGKTHLAIAALRKIAAEKLWRPHVVQWAELCTITQEGWSSKRVDETAVWSKARRATILLIDDLDKLPSSPWAMGRLFALINNRYDHKKPTIITANHTVAGLRELWRSNDVGMAVISRIMGQLIKAVEIIGSDTRWSSPPTE